MSAEVSATASSPLSPDRNLPPVQPPTFGFLIQLFVVPGLIVTAIVAVWMLFNWLAHMGSDPLKELETVRGGSQGRWHAAHNLAVQLQEDRKANGPLTKDRELCRKLSSVLDEALKNDSIRNKEDLELRYFLTRALGLFVVDDGAELLFKLAETQRDDAEIPIQIAALDGLSMLASALAEPSQDQPATTIWKDRDRLRDLLLKDSKLPGDLNLEFRLRTAYHLAEFAEPAVVEQLEVLQGDAVLEVRCNAATSLAKQGQVIALPVLKEMLELTQDDLLPGVQSAIRKAKEAEAERQNNLKDNEKSRTLVRDDQSLNEREQIAIKQNEKSIANSKRLLILRNALESLVLLKKLQPQADFSMITPTIEQLKSDPNRELNLIANDTLLKLQAK